MDTQEYQEGQSKEIIIKKHIIRIGYMAVLIHFLRQEAVYLDDGDKGLLGKCGDIAIVGRFPKVCESVASTRHPLS